MEQPLVRANISAQQANLVAIQRQALEGVELARVDGAKVILLRGTRTRCSRLQRHGRTNSYLSGASAWG
jgi:hypothetical protein